MSLMMADIDHFKKINDTYGHLFGDQCLMKVAGILKKCVTNPDDLAARFGGEEFIIMLPNTDSKTAASIAELIRKNIEKLRMNHEGEQIKFTISIGVATIVPTRIINSSDLNERADQALYLAKEAGRNRVVAADGESALTPS
jgi:diguanylate cyclase